LLPIFTLDPTTQLLKLLFNPIIDVESIIEFKILFLNKITYFILMIFNKHSQMNHKEFIS